MISPQLGVVQVHPWTGNLRVVTIDGEIVAGPLPAAQTARLARLLRRAIGL
jgi:hypothetical protein